MTQNNIFEDALKTITDIYERGDDIGTAYGADLTPLHEKDSYAIIKALKLAAEHTRNPYTPVTEPFSVDAKEDKK